MKQVQVEPALDEMLGHVLTPPQVPIELQARVMAAVARDTTPDIDHLRNTLQNEYMQSVNALRQCFMQRSAEALVLACCIFLPVRAGVAALSIPLINAYEHLSPLLR